MKKSFRLGLSSALCICVLSLLSCDKKESNVKAELLPESPVTINADYKYYDQLADEEVTVTKPWFSFRMKVKNNSQKRITITAATLDIQGQKDGKPTQSTNGYTGEGVDETTPRFDTNCDGAVVAGVDVIGALYELEPGQGCTSNVVLYAGALPEDDDFRYNVTAKFVGWYNKIETSPTGTRYGIPDERLEVIQSFTTQ